MGNTGRLMRAMPLAGAVMLASCGGGSDLPAPPDQQASPGIVVSQPAPSASTSPAELFVTRARAETCADKRNRLFVIDGKQVLWDRAGNCADNAYAQRLYGATPDTLLCEAADSLAGPRISCNDPGARAMFDTILRHLDSADLGLGSAHAVELLTLLPMKDLERSSRSLVVQPKNVVVRDAAAFAALWTEHAGTAPAPQVDFTRSMVIGVFLGSRANGCYSTSIDSVVRANGKLSVTRTDTEPGPNVLCTLAIVQPAHLVVVERSDAPVEFSSQVKVLK